MPNNSWDAVVVGGGAAGFFAAIAIKEARPETSVLLLEKSNKFLAKVKVSGGGRCNVTNACTHPKQLASHYPRGEHFLKKAFGRFGSKETIEWFENKGVPLKKYPDGCIFPLSNDSQTVIDCFLEEASRHRIELRLKSPVRKLRPVNSGFIIELDEDILHAKKVILATGGQPKRSGLDWIVNLGVKAIDPVPSLFTFNLPKNPITELMGIVIEKTEVRLEGTKLRAQGPLLVTHWGLSGPAILKLSAWGAREIAERTYNFCVFVNWLQSKEEEVKKRWLHTAHSFPERQLKTTCPFDLPVRLWNYILKKASVHEETVWRQCSEKQMNKVIEVLLNDRFEVSGKTTYKEEFVTAGGICLSEINHRTMECKELPGLYVVGELLDVDGITGGFNFQAAWTTAYIAGISAAE
jgi:predicted Rossmann fold flavoprotein